MSLDDIKKELDDFGNATIEIELSQEQLDNIFPKKDLSTCSMYGCNNPARVMATNVDGWTGMFCGQCDGNPRPIEEVIRVFSSDPNYIDVHPIVV